MNYNVVFMAFFTAICSNVVAVGPDRAASPTTTVDIHDAMNPQGFDEEDEALFNNTQRSLAGSFAQEALREKQENLRILSGSHPALTVAQIRDLADNGYVEVVEYNGQFEGMTFDLVTEGDFNDGDAVVLLSCDHVFHMTTLSVTLRIASVCPYCFASIYNQ